MIENLYQTIIDTPIGLININANENAITKIQFLSELTSINHYPSNTLTEYAAEQFTRYFATPSSAFIFDLPLAPLGTAYQQKVWSSLAAIPFGKTLTYGDIACELQTGARAVGNACRTNPFPIVIPCHRVVAKSHLGGFTGATTGFSIEVKKHLLKREGYKLI